jgi:hypothetical protein
VKSNVLKGIKVDFSKLSTSLHNVYYFVLRARIKYGISQLESECLSISIDAYSPWQCGVEYYNGKRNLDKQTKPTFSFTRLPKEQ